MTSKLNRLIQEQKLPVRGRYCELHPKMKLEYVCSHPERVGSVFKCSLCKLEGTISDEYFVSIAQVVDSENSEVLLNWPLPSERTLLQQVKVLTAHDPIQQRSVISTFFKDLVSSIMKEVEIIEKAAYKNLQLRTESCKKLLKEYNTRSYKSALKQVLDENSPDEKLQESRVSAIVTQMNFKQEDTKQAFQELVSRAIQLNLEESEAAKQEIIQKLTQIEFYRPGVTIPEEFKIEKPRWQDSLVERLKIKETKPPENTQLEKWTYYRPNFSGSQELSVFDSIYGGISVRQPYSAYGTAASEQIINNSLAYQVIIKFNKPLCQKNDIRIGLIEDEKVEKEGVGSNFLEQVFCSFPGRGASKVLKGLHLNHQQLSDTIDEIEFKFCIETQTFSFSDLQHQNIVTCSDKRHIKPKGVYRFGLTFYYPGDDYSFTFKEVRSSTDQSFGKFLQ